MRAIVIALVSAACIVVLQGRPQTSPFLGAWNLTGVAPDNTYVYWLEVKEENGQLSGMFLNRGGNPNPLAEVRVEGDELVFRGGQAGKPAGPTYRARLQDGRLTGQHTLPAPGATAAGTPAPAERAVNWIGIRQHEWRPFNANGTHTYGTPVNLFDGASLTAFRGQQAEALRGWSVVDGIAVNEPKADNLVSKETFFNFSIEAEYRLGPKSNSGIYLRGRYELQVLDDFSDTTTRPDLTHMAIYGRTAPAVKASRPPGEWQQMSAVLVGNRVTVTLNGQRVHDNTPILGITGGALDANELTPGPIMIQGDHTGVWLRRVVVTPITRVGG
jgi:hypothetical protein